MEATRKIVGIIFWIVLIVGGLGIVIALVGGAFPINWGTGEQTIKFDLTNTGWENVDPGNGVMAIVHEGTNKKEGWGSMQFDYKYMNGKEPGFKTTTYDVEGLIYMNLWMKAKKPCKWQVQFKRKSDSMVFKKTFNVGTQWKQYTINPFDMRDEVGYKGKFSRNDFQKLMTFVDISTKKQGETNTVWIDHIVITK
jgi:hypothetical protein